MKLSLRWTVLMVVLGLVLTTAAQRHVVVFEPDHPLPAKWIRPITVGRSLAQADVVRDQILFLQARGYLEASCDTCFVRGDSSYCPIAVGRPYRWARLRSRGIPGELASEAGLREKLYDGRPVAPRQIASTIRTLLERSENSGYPFARVWLDSLQQTEDGLSAVLRADRGRLVTYDSVVVRGSVRTSARYLQASIGIRPGDVYDESVLNAVETRLRELPFVSQKQRPYVQFTPENTKLFLFLDAKKASSINGVLGLQPDANTGKVNLTGDIDLRLRNALRRGEAIALNWRSLQNSTQDLKVAGNLPFAFNTPFGIDASLKLFKRDSTFLEVTSRIGLEYLMTRGDKVTLFLNSKSNDRLGSNTIAQPGLADVRLISYGLGFVRERLDYRFNPRRGHGIQIEGSAGRKRTSQAVFGLVEQPLEINTVQMEVLGTLLGHVALGRRSTLRFAAQGGRMLNDDLYANELYRIGGLKTLRGMDEASITASSYTIGTVEYRFLYEENSNFFLFVDQAWWERRVQEEYSTDTPMGVGLGTTFETKAGLFSITYALGQQFDNPVQLRGGKVHFGFISLF
ncbi:MAG TPA: BamA/TamA family outer membrane protein [Flavobacteriales bacterium]|nr:BamA/TamA family outer membrane protein [Flavobacteriales bacterium]